MSHHRPQHQPPDPDGPRQHHRETIASKPVPTAESAYEQDFVAYVLAIHNLMLTATYVILVGNMTRSVNMTWFGLTMLAFHFVLAEVMVRGVKSRSYKRLLPWFAVVLIEEFVVLGLAVTHLGDALAGLGYSYGRLFSHKGGFMVLMPCLTGT